MPTDDHTTTKARPRPPALETPMVLIVLTGTAIWALVGLSLLPFRARLESQGHGWWLSMCLAGVVLGLIGLAMMLRREANQRRRQAAR